MPAQFLVDSRKLFVTAVVEQHHFYYKLIKSSFTSWPRITSLFERALYKSIVHTKKQHDHCVKHANGFDIVENDKNTRTQPAKHEKLYS